MEAKVKSYFDRYPLSNEVYEKGGKLFHTKGAADSYPKGDETKKHTRGQITDIVNDKKSEKEQAVELLKATEDIATLDYNVMRSLVKGLELTTAGQGKETLIAALTEFKTTLNAD